MARKDTYKDCLTKGVDPMDGQYIEMKIAQKFEIISPEWKKTLKEEIMMELKGELYNKLEEFKRDMDAKMDISFSGSEENDDIAGHGQRLAEYFHTINSKMPPTEEHEYIERRSLYVIFEGKMPGLYISFEEVVAQKKDGKLDGGISWKKYGDIDEAMIQARKILGTNYYMEPAAKEYIQKYRKAKGIKIPETSSGIKDMARKDTYKDCLTKGVDPMDGQYIEMKIAQKFEIISPEWKKTLKEEIMMELKGELYNKLEEFKRDMDAKMDISFSGSEENDDIAGHGQRSE
ncbi:hypothetical protein U9M48_038728 [Paspalum notatum var. saurae]|uniref:Uncharacterized protein n=1 Tax=Paspalum notatum var. saurae TaxID=547442 RepID=A0AAQ3XDV5_PASNO